MIASIRGKKPHVYRVIILKQMADHTISGAKYLSTKRNFISHFSIGSKGACDDAVHLVGRLVTSIYSSNVAGDFAQ